MGSRRPQPPSSPLSAKRRRHQRLPIPLRDGPWVRDPGVLSPISAKRRRQQRLLISLRGGARVRDHRWKVAPDSCVRAPPCGDEGMREDVNQYFSNLLDPTETAHLVHACGVPQASQRQGERLGSRKGGGRAVEGRSHPPSSQRGEGGFGFAAHSSPALPGSSREMQRGKQGGEDAEQQGGEDADQPGGSAAGKHRAARRRARR